MTPRLRAALSVVISLVALPLAAAPDGGPSAAKLALVIWGGGAASADADRAAAAFASRGFTSSKPLAKLESSKVPGLNPGFHIAVLGACSLRDGARLVRRLRARESGVYLRRIPASDAVRGLECPKVSLPKRPWTAACDDETHEITHAEDLDLADGHLRVSATATFTCNGEVESAAWSATATLERPRGTELDTATAEAPDWSQILDLRREGKTVVLEAEENVGSCATSEMFDARTIRRTFSASGGKLVVREKVLDQKMGLCEPSHEGVSDCEWAPRYDRYAATRDACAISVAACKKAQQRYDRDHASDPSECSERGQGE